ncbi:transcriptional activator hap3 [Malassezia caprae]|uniref:Transcriptional activator hap3 n=1 Tax=Malassezia caprae TaxID=1381934 RepID=A0AAF0E4N6_9BASI|nr:transcriptional activator hap3 [Malassezia caprae]
MTSADNSIGTLPTVAVDSGEAKNMAMPAAGALEPEARAMAPGFASTTEAGAGATESPDTSKTEGSEASRSWPTSLPPLPPHLAGADLPIANISRIMKRALPENGKIAKNAKECMQECVSELISFITSEASDRCGSEKRKTINGDDILYALRVLGFDNYEQVLKVYLSRYRQAQEENPRHRRRKASKRRYSYDPAVDGELSMMDGTVVENDVHDDDDDHLSDEAEE